MPPLPFFLKRLGLDTDADERAVRRAYSARLKALDPEADPMGFQALHEAYQAALAWARKQPAPMQGLPFTTPAAPPVSPKPAEGLSSFHESPPFETEARREPRPSEPRPAPRLLNHAPDPRALAEAVFASFRDLALTWPSGRPRRVAKVADRTLRRHLLDPRLVPLEARRAFEEQVVGLLSEPGLKAQQATLRAASGVFQWDQDRRRLDQFGAPGAKLNQAIDLELFRKSRPKGLRVWLRKADFTFFGIKVTRVAAILFSSLLLIVRVFYVAVSDATPPRPVPQVVKIPPNLADDGKDALAPPPGLPGDPGPAQDAALARLYSMTPKRPPNWLSRGYARQRKGQRDLAMSDYNEAIRLGGENAAVLNNRGVLWLRRGELDLAVSDFSEAIRLDQRLAAPFFNQGRIWASRGNTAAAADDFKAALKLDPGLAKDLPEGYRPLVSTPASSRSGWALRGH